MQNDLEKLTDKLVAAALESLRRYDSLAPMGALVTPEGHDAPIVEIDFDKADEREAREVVASIVAALRSAVAQQRARAVSWSVDVRVRHPVSGKATDAVAVFRETRETSELVFQPYRRGLFRRVKLAERWAVSRPSEVFGFEVDCDRSPEVASAGFVAGRYLTLKCSEGWRLVRPASGASTDTFQRLATDAVLQLSVRPLPDAIQREAADLEEDAKRFGEKLGWGTPAESRHGTSALGSWGRAVFRPEPPLPLSPPVVATSVWMNARGKNLVLATLLCAGHDEREQAEADAMVKTVRIIER